MLDAATDFLSKEVNEDPTMRIPGIADRYSD
jgi:hypothetical protein